MRRLGDKKLLSGLRSNSLSAHVKRKAGLRNPTYDRTNGTMEGRSGHAKL